MHEKHEKTNAMRQLDRKKAVYTAAGRAYRNDKKAWDLPALRCCRRA